MKIFFLVAWIDADAVILDKIGVLTIADANLICSILQGICQQVSEDRTQPGDIAIELRHRLNLNVCECFAQR